MKVYIETYGCTMNQGDTGVMIGIIEKEHELVDDARDCDVAVINSCGVIGFTERKVLKRVSWLRENNKKVVVAGCLPGINPNAVRDSMADAVITPKNLFQINRAIDTALNVRSSSPLPGQESHAIEGQDIINVDPRRFRKRLNKTTAIVPIAVGCLGKCSYCGTRLVRGRLKSFEPDAIIDEVRGCVRHGIREVRLTGQDTGVYGIDRAGLSPRLPDLLEKISKIPGEFRVRVGMMNPQYVLEILDELVESFRNEKIYKFLHVPVQSGDDRVLEDMRRGYTADDFRAIVRSFQERFNDLTLSTDIIVGYPTEDEESFRKTLDLIEEVRPDIINITRFSKRPNTPAAKLKDMPDRYKKERSRKLTALHKKIGTENNKRFIGRVVKVLITENGKNGTLLGRTGAYRQVVLDQGRYGKFVRVKITGATATYLIGEQF